ncbi:hypothetical protein PG989_015616 [Apiospora arundinis]
MQNTGFSHVCGHQSGIYDEMAELYDTLAMNNLVYDWPDMERTVETCCAQCWSSATTSPALLGQCKKVLNNEFAGQELVHSLFVMLYHLGSRLVADPSEMLIGLLRNWAEYVATRYVYMDNPTYQERVYSAIYTSKIPKLVCKDAVTSIKAFRAPADWPSVNDATPKREALAATFRRLEQFDHDLRWSLSSPWPACIKDDLLTVLAYNGIRYASLFKTKPLNLQEFGLAFEPVAKRPHDYSIYVYHTKLVDAVEKLKLESYQLNQFAADHSEIKSKEELKTIMTTASTLKASFQNVLDLHASFVEHLAIWKST